MTPAAHLHIHLASLGTIACSNSKVTRIRLDERPFGCGQVAILVSAVISIVWTLIAPDRNASWEQLRADLHEKIEVLDDAQVRQHFSPSICG